MAFHFQDFGSRQVVADFSGGYLSGDGAFAQQAEFAQTHAQLTAWVDPG